MAVARHSVRNAHDPMASRSCNHANAAAKVAVSSIYTLLEGQFSYLWVKSFLLYLTIQIRL